jgi:hypothetical protein
MNVLNFVVQLSPESISFQFLLWKSKEISGTVTLYLMYHVHERDHSTAVITYASYLGGPGFKSRPEDRLSCKRFFVVILSPPRHVWIVT